MRISQISLKLILAIVFSTFLLAACSTAPSRGYVGTEISNHIKVGATKDEVLKYTQGLEIKGTKAVSSGYLKTDKAETIPIDGKDVAIEGTIILDFRGHGITYCGAFVIFYFDKSERLITYVVDDIFC